MASTMRGTTLEDSDLDAPRVARAKLHSPMLASALVPREGICARVREAAAVRLVLVRAPAGFGKSTAMAQCRAEMERSNLRTAWLNLDASDNDPIRFSSGLSAAATALGAGALGLGAVDLGDTARVLMDSLAEGQPFCIFIDDFEVIQNPVVASIVRGLVHHLPRHGRLMLASRVLPDLGLARLRARGQLLEITVGELRFSEQETSDFFQRRLRSAIQSEDLRRLHHETEGWPAALWLASLALERQGRRPEYLLRPGGSSQMLSDYLLEEVFAAQAPAMQEFLLRTSLLRSFDAPTCEAVLGSDSLALLHGAAASDLFLAPSIGDGTYRYHRLFGDFLRKLLARTRLAELPMWQMAASRWFESQGRPVPAIDHAIEGGHFERALDLLQAQVESLLEQGRMRLLARWFETLPEGLLQQRPLLGPAQVWASCFTRGPWDAMALLDRGRWSPEIPAIATHLLALRPILLAMMDRYEEAYELGRQNLQRLGNATGFAASVLSNTMAYVFLVMGEYRESSRLLDAARHVRPAGVSRFNTMYAQTVEGLRELEEGELRKAAARFRLALQSSEPGVLRHAVGNAFAGVPHALALYESGEWGQAESLLGVYVPLARGAALRDHIILGHVMLSRMAFHHGQLDQAWDWLARLEQEGYERGLPRLTASARLERAHLQVLQGQAHAARAELERAAADQVEVWDRVALRRFPAHDLEDLALGRLRWEACLGDAERASSMAEEALELALAQKRKRRALKLQLFKAIALRRAGRLPQALEQLVRLLPPLRHEGCVRLVADEGAAAGQLFQSLLADTHRLRLLQVSPLFEEYLRRVMQAFGTLPPLADLPKRTSIETLTPTEMRLLQLLADGLSNSELAQRLSVSQNTVRTHLRNINAKFQARSRTQAAAIARRLGLIT